MLYYPLPVIEIQMIHDFVSVIDEIDFRLASQCWRTHNGSNTFRAGRTVRRNKVKREVWLHSIILENKIGRKLTSGEMCDHVDGDGLNNRRCNLRVASNQQNQFNARRRKDNTSGYKGVDFHRSKWRARIRINKKQTNLGYFDTPEEAHRARLDAAKAHHGEFAK